MTTTPSHVTLITQVNSSDAPVNPDSNALQADGQVAPLLNGGYVVVWTDSSRQPFPGGKPLGSAIIAQRYDSSEWFVHRPPGEANEPGTGAGKPTIV
jgi:hypothetical protein